LFDPQPELLDYTQKDWQELTQATFDTIFKNSAVKRTQYEGLKRNLSFIRR